MTDATDPSPNDSTSNEAPPPRRSVTDDLKHSARRIWLAGLGALAVAEREGSKAFNTLVEHGESFEERSKPHVDELRAKARKARDEAKEKLRSMEKRLATRLQGAGMAAQEQVDELKQRIADLEATLERMAKHDPASDPTATEDDDAPRDPS